MRNLENPDGYQEQCRTGLVCFGGRSDVSTGCFDRVGLTDGIYRRMDESVHRGN